MSNRQQIYNAALQTLEPMAKLSEYEPHSAQAEAILDEVEALCRADRCEFDRQMLEIYRNRYWARWQGDRWQINYNVMVVARPVRWGG